MTHPIIEEIAAARGISVYEVTAHAHTKSSRGARYEAAYRLVAETELPIRDIAALLNYADWSGVNFAVAAHARSLGAVPMTTSEMRHGTPMRAIDWPALAKCAGTLGPSGFRKVGVSRMVWVQLLRGKRINADDLVIVTRRLEINLVHFLTKEGKAIKPFS
jgi:hypothetical protein